MADSDSAALREATHAMTTMTSGFHDLRAEIQTVEKNSSKRSDDVHELLREQTKGLFDIRVEVAGFSTSLSSHTQEDNRRFSLIWRMILGGGGVTGVGGVVIYQIFGGG